MNEGAQPATELVAQSAAGHTDEDRRVERKKTVVGSYQNTYRREFAVDEPRVCGE